MKVVPVAFDSLGVRSMASLVEAGGKKVFIDPSAALGPIRYGLPPAGVELQALDEAKKAIREIALQSDILIVTHYHYDHHDSDEDFYKNKVVLAKSISENINYSQKGRGGYFKKQVENACKLEFADNKSFSFDDVKITFSPPFPHGPEGIRLGFVLMCCIECKKEKILFASDCQGPVSEQARDWIIERKPDLLVMDGPPTYLLGYKFSVQNLEKAKENMLAIMKETNAKVILDHHLLRDLNYRKHYAEVFDTGKAFTAAEFLGKENNMLEAHRKELWKGKKPNYTMIPLKKDVKYD